MLIDSKEAKLLRANQANQKVKIDSLGKSFLVGKMPAIAEIKLKQAKAGGKDVTELDALRSAFEHGCTDGAGDSLTAADADQVASLISLEELHDLLESIGQAADKATRPVAPAAPAAPPPSDPPKP
jgi:hypothetical protein